ncbi:hypothetical protein ALC56_13232 [Trachymyrmex septentrionalis]|uniref:Uncharacterized protein n=1 Tax=Trachymyrmex septentrionalis TaxID=34720 RepID=A0A195EVT5_9HYME|nr:hypothetical protein ALC56_13232 [Trachymyrmex septentrionalis]
MEVDTENVTMDETDALMRTDDGGGVITSNVNDDDGAPTVEETYEITTTRRKTIRTSYKIQEHVVHFEYYWYRLVIPYDGLVVLEVANADYVKFTKSFRCIIRILPDGDKNEGDERKRAARVRALLARSAGTRQKFLFALGHPTLRLRGREVTALQSAINDADKILGIHAIRVREEVQRRVVRVFALLCRAHRDAIILCEIYYERVVTTILGTKGNCDMYLF